MRVFKPKYEYIWSVAIDDYTSLPESEKDWDKIDQLSDNKVMTKYRELKKKVKISEGILDQLTDRYNAAVPGDEEAAELLNYMGQVIDVLKIQYFFVHTLQEIIQIRSVIS